MQLDEIIATCRKLAQPYCITEGDKFRLKNIDPDDTAWLEAEDKPRAQESLQVGVQALVELQANFVRSESRVRNDIWSSDDQRSGLLKRRALRRLHDRACCTRKIRRR